MISKEIPQYKISLKGRLSYSDYKDFQLLHSHSKYNLVFMAVFLFAVFMLTGLISSSLEETLTPLFILSGIATSLLVTSLSRIVTNYRLKSVFASDKLLQKEYFYLFDDCGISTESEVGNGKIKWCEVYKVKRNKKLHVIYVAKNKALIIPRSFFESLEQVKEFESILSDNLSVKQYKYR